MKHTPADDPLVLLLYENNNYDYYMAEQNTICKMTSTPWPQEKDIGVIFDNSLQLNSHITNTVKKCQQILSINILSIIKGSFDFIDENIMTLIQSDQLQNIQMLFVIHNYENILICWNQYRGEQLEWCQIKTTTNLN